MTSSSSHADWLVVRRGILLTFTVLLGVYLARELQSVIVQVLVTILLAASLAPLVDALTVSARAKRWRWRPSRGVAAILVLFGAFLALSLGVVFVVGAVVPDLMNLAANAPAYLRTIQNTLEGMFAGNPEVAERVGGLVTALGAVLGDASFLLSQIPSVLGAATFVFSGLVYLAFTLTLAIYLTVDAERIRGYLMQFVPVARRPQAERVNTNVGSRLGAWARGQVLLAAIVGGLTWLGALVIGLPYAGALALIAAVGEVIPNFGPIISGVALVLVGLLLSPTHAVGALVLAIAIQQLENNLIAPRVMGQAVNLHPVAVMLAIIVGNQLLGIMGAVLGVPVAASLAVVINEVLSERSARRAHSAASRIDSRLPDQAAAAHA